MTTDTAPDSGSSSCLVTLPLVGVHPELGAPFLQGAEARLYRTQWFGQAIVVKERFVKTYRVATLDRSLTLQRMRAEVKALVRCRAVGIPAPLVYYVDFANRRLFLEEVRPAVTCRQHIDELLAAKAHSSVEALAQRLGAVVARLHLHQMVHGDLTTSNVLLRGDGSGAELVLIDFGLAQLEASAEEKAVDLYVMERAFLCSHPGTIAVFELLLASYRQHTDAARGSGGAEVMRKLAEVRLRGRKRLMIG